METPLDNNNNNTNNNNMDHIQSEFISINGCQLCLHQWKPTTTTNNIHTSSSSTRRPIQAVVLIYHGYLAHGLFPTVKYAAELFCQSSSNHIHINNTKVFSVDLRGHGRSEGLSGYLPSPELLLQDALEVAQYIQTHHVLPKNNNNNDNNDNDDDDDDSIPIPKFFLVGSSMGGAIALGVAQLCSTTTTTRKISIDGVILLAPMLQLAVSSFQRILLYGLAQILPTLSCIPSSSTSTTLQYRDPNKRYECEQDPYVRKQQQQNQKTTIRIASAYTCVALTEYLQFTKITVPLFILVADQDVIVQNQGAIRLYQEASSLDKTIKHYPALHGLLCEPKPLIDEIANDLLHWIQARL